MPMTMEILTIVQHQIFFRYATICGGFKLGDFVYLYNKLVGTRDLRKLWSPPKVSGGGAGGAKKDKIIKYIWLVLSV
jgi:hypothetical protein